jgi:hypothetical protein
VQRVRGALDRDVDEATRRTAGLGEETTGLMGKMVLYTRPGDGPRKLARGEEPQANPVGAELAAMQAIADAMAALPDDEARRRVVEWIAERFDVQPKQAAPASSTVEFPATPAHDSSLSVAGLEEFFDGPATEHWPQFPETERRGLGLDLPADVIADFTAEVKPADDDLEGIVELETPATSSVAPAVEALEVPDALELPEVVEVPVVLEIPDVPGIAETPPLAALAPLTIVEAPVDQAFDHAPVAQEPDVPAPAAQAGDEQAPVTLSPEPTADAPKQPVTVMLQSLAEDFRKLARDWESA